MDAKEFSRIKERIEIAKEEKARAEGAIQQIQERWKKDYGFSSIEKAEEKIEILNAEAKKTNKKIESLFQELKDMINESE